MWTEQGSGQEGLRRWDAPHSADLPGVTGNRVSAPALGPHRTLCISVPAHGCPQRPRKTTSPSQTAGWNTVFLSLLNIKLWKKSTAQIPTVQTSVAVWCVSLRQLITVSGLYLPCPRLGMEMKLLSVLQCHRGGVEGLPHLCHQVVSAGLQLPARTSTSLSKVKIISVLHCHTVNPSSYVWPSFLKELPIFKQDEVSGWQSGVLELVVLWYWGPCPRLRGKDSFPSELTLTCL